MFKASSVAVLVLAFAGLLAGCISSDQATVQNLVNADRTSHGVATLADYSPADAKAQAWAEHLAVNGVGEASDLSHSNLADGYSGTRWCRLGENVGMGPSIESTQPAFMNSPGHRANILDARFDHIGTGVAKNTDTGYVYVVQEFVDLC